MVVLCNIKSYYYAILVITLNYIIASIAKYFTNIKYKES
ncbi:hypothetical protein ACFW04_000128 [Cataglyphis niger]